MKKILCLFMIILVLTGCEEESLFVSYTHLNETVRTALNQLNLLWAGFEAIKNNNQDPADLFHQSAYLAKLKEFLAQRESLSVSINDLSQILRQYDLSSIEKKQP